MRTALSRGARAWLKTVVTTLRVATVVTLMGLPAALPAQSDAARETFLAAEKLLNDGRVDAARTLMQELEGYPLLGHLELTALEARLSTLSHARVLAILRSHADLPGAAAVRRQWLERLAREGRHETLLQHFDDDQHTPSACLAAEAERRTGRTAEAWARAARLWRTGRSLPDACDPVLSAWRAAGQLTPSLAWERFALAMETNSLRLARYLARFVTSPDRALADSWLALRGAPDGLPRFAANVRGDTTKRARVLRHVFARVARRDTAKARRMWPALSGAGLPSELLDTLRERLGEALARERAPDALEWLQQARSVSALTARAVEGIRIGALDDVADAVAAMPGEEADRERWRYWRARGLLAKNPALADDEMRALARERSYYGFLAAERVAAPYAFGHAAIEASDAQLQALSRLPGAIRAREWLHLDRPEEARQEWAHLLATLDATDQRSAARLAHLWNWPEAAIRAAAAARAWSDLEVRFPLAHDDAVKRAAGDSGLPASRVYAVIRQESAFMRDIRSRAGALGLMQLMPATARQVARSAGLPRPNRHAILDPQRNLLLGSLYLERLERRYDGHRVLATAAYNAGPGRVHEWRPRDGAMSSEAWIETIPFRETRRYVRQVLAYQIIYAHRLGTPALKLSELMPPVSPG